jgi:hypothetical protein
MTERIRVPDELRGDFEHAVICTYGANLEFFERDIWRHLSSIGNCVVLADDRMLADAWGKPEGVDARHVNISYVVAPIRNVGAAHAKMILLTSPTQGRLLVGSGNLSMDGYASQGEQFCRYEVTPEDRSQLGAFHSAKAFLEGLLARGYVDPIASRHVEQAWASAPWMYASSTDDDNPVRDNLEVPLIDQLIEAVGADPVDELIAFAPFYDQSAGALRQLIDRLRPARVEVLVQRNETSVDPQALEQVLSDHGAARVRAVEAERSGTYLHAKFVLVNQRSRTVCLAGSPNLSLVALCQADPAGNLELASLQSGPPSSFGHILAALEISDEDLALKQAGLSFRRGPSRSTPSMFVVQAVLADGTLTVELSSAVAAGATLVLLVAGSEFPGAELIEVDGTRVRFRLNSGLLHGAVPVSIQLQDQGDVMETAYVYPYHAANLARLLAGRRNPEILRRTADLDLHDDEIEQLLEELNQVLLVNVESVWRVAGKEPSVTDSAGGGDAPSLRWDELDWENLRRHPRLAQYSAARSTAQSLEPTDLQVILTSITEHFHRGDRSHQGDIEDFMIDFDEDLASEVEPQTEEEREEQEAARARRRLSTETRNRMAVRRFSARCIEGLSDDEFLDRVGPAVAVTNFIIFNHLLSLLVRRDRLDLESGVSFQLDLWRFLWGDELTGGYLTSLDTEEREVALKQIREHSADVMTLAGLFWAAAASDELPSQMRMQLRDALRHLAVMPELGREPSVATAALEEIGSDLPRTIDIARVVLSLAEETTRAELLEALTAAVAPGSGGHFDKAIVMRGGGQGRVDLIVLEGSVEGLDSDAARRALTIWARMEPGLAYYRIDHPASRSVAVLDREFGECWWARKGQGDLVELGEIEPPSEPWRTALMEALVSEGKSEESA